MEDEISESFWFAFLRSLRMLKISLRDSQSFLIPLFQILCLDLYPIFIELLEFLLSSFLGSLYILHISPLSDVVL